MEAVTEAIDVGTLRQLIEATRGEIIRTEQRLFSLCAVDTVAASDPSGGSAASGGRTVGGSAAETHTIWAPPPKCIPICADVRSFDFKVCGV
jgi:hypothetical protein